MSILTLEVASVLLQNSSDMEGFAMGKRNKSKRFVQQGVDAVSKHDDRIPYHTTYAEAEAQKMANVKESSLGGI
ncbi:Uncharacterised protein [Mycobacteroides abscessus subsp. abscessus]|nr:Uncharacterised protein [Mycobacteroides abscessus subsp. abscessus]